MLDLYNSFRNRESGVERNGVVEAWWKAFFRLYHQRFGTFSGSNGVRSGKLVNGNHGRWLAIQSSLQVIDLGAELCAGYILQTYYGTVSLGADHDFAELFFRGKAALRTNGVGIFLAHRNRFAADLPCRIDIVLRLNRVDDFRDSDLQLSQLIGLDPKTHRILACAKNGYAGDSGHSSKLVV